MIYYQVLLPAALAFVLFFNSLPGEFCYDDSRAIKRNPDVLGETSLWSLFGNDFWGTPLLHSGSHKSYRPLCTLTFRLNHLVGGLTPLGFHLSNVVLHSLNTALYSATLSRVLGLGRVQGSERVQGLGRVPLLAGLLFACHPVHTEAVAGVVGRADLMSCFFFLLALNVYTRYCEARDTDEDLRGTEASRHVSTEVICQKPQQRIHEMSGLYSTPGRNLSDSECDLDSRSFKTMTWPYLIGFGSCVLCAMLSKEQGISVLFVCILHDVFIKSRLTFFQVPSILYHDDLSGLRRGIVFNLFLCVVFVSVRLHVIGMNPPSFSPSDNPASDSDSLTTRTLTFLFLPVFNFGLLLCPSTLSFDWSMGAVELVSSIWDMRNALSLVFYFSLFWFFFRLATNMNVHHSVAAACPGHVFPLTKNDHVSTSKYRSLSSFLTSRAKHPHKNGPETSHATWIDFNSTCEDGDDRWRPLLLGLSILVFPFVPASNLFFYVGFVVAERVLYIPSMGFCLVVAMGIHLLLARLERRPLRFLMGSRSGSDEEIISSGEFKNGRKHLDGMPTNQEPGTSSIHLSKPMRRLSTSQRILRASHGIFLLTFLLLLLFSIKTILRNQDWLTEESLYKSGIPVNPAKAWGNLANVLNSRGKARQAEHAYKTALLYRNNMADVHYNLGILYQEQGRYAEAVQSYEHAIQCRPRLTMAHLNLAIVLTTVGRKSEAEQIYRHCSEIDTSGLKDPRLHEHTKISSLYNLGRLLADEERHEEAISTYLKALERRPPHYPTQSIYNMLGESYSRLGQLDSAEFNYKMALQVKPDHVPAHLTLAKLYHRKGQPEEAEKLYLKCLEIDPTDFTTHQHYGQFLGEVGRLIESAESYLEASRLAPADFEVVFNTANALRNVGRNREAEDFYRRSTEIQPETALTHMNLGAILHYNGKLEEAERSYLRALELKPGDSVTESNLNKLRSLAEKKRNLQSVP